jgi:hypothetical protein
VEPHLGLMTRYLLIVDSYGLVLLGRPLWRGDGPRPRSLPQVRIRWNSWPYFNVSDLRYPFSPPPTIRRVTVDVFDPASTRVLTRSVVHLQDNFFARTPWKTRTLLVSSVDLTENTTHMVSTQRVHWRVDYCLATSYKHSFYWRVCNFVAYSLKHFACC